MRDDIFSPQKQPNETTLELIQKIKLSASLLYGVLENENITPTREISLAKTKLEESVMWAVKSICKNQKES